jgi:hypothetical protein
LPLLIVRCFGQLSLRMANSDIRGGKAGARTGSKAHASNSDEQANEKPETRPGFQMDINDGR